MNVLKKLRKNFGRDSAWNGESESNKEFDMQKFFDSCIFKDEDQQQSDVLSWELLSLFAVYTCRQGSKTAIHRKARQIANASSEKSIKQNSNMSTKNKPLQQDLFIQAV